MNFTAERSVKVQYHPSFKILWPSQLSDLLYHLNRSLCISQAISSRPDFLWSSHFLSWITSMWPACPVHTDAPAQPVWQPVYCWSYSMAVVQYLNLIQWRSELGLSSLPLWCDIVNTHPACLYVNRSEIVCSLNGRYVAFSKLPHLQFLSSF